MLYLLIIIAFAVSVLLSSLILPRILVVAFRKRLFELPEGKSAQRGAVSRLGGLSFVPVILFSIAFTIGLRYVTGYPFSPDSVSFITPEFCMWICGLTFLYLSGIKEDLIGLQYRTKAMIQAVAASFFPLSGLWLNHFCGLGGSGEIPFWIGIPLTLLITLFLMHVVNRIDEVDGLASGLSSLSLILLGSLFLYKQHWIYALLAFSTLGVLLPFFYYNVFGYGGRGKKIYMGSTGSQTLGYILSFLIIRYVSYAPALEVCAEDSLFSTFSVWFVPVCMGLHHPQA